MRFRSLRYCIDDGLRSLTRNRFMALTSILTVSACGFILVLSYCIAVNLDSFLEKLENSGGISVSIDKAVSNADLNGIYSNIAEIEHITEVKYISPEEGLASFSKSLDESEALYHVYRDDNPLPRRFVITLDSSKYLEQVISKLEQLQKSNIGISKVNHAKNTIAILITVNNVIRVISIIVVIALSVLAVVIITNTIRLTVNNRKTEINIMKYVGATDRFIKIPFVVEGIAIGIIGNLIPLIAIWLMYPKIIERLQIATISLHDFFDFCSAYEIFPVLFPIVLVFGVIIGICGSLISIRKHLNV